jgi:glycosyltransferase involved in cell wall biosynthesis
VSAQQLPNLAQYRQALCAAGARWPLPCAPWSRDGLIGELPRAETEARERWPWSRPSAMPDNLVAADWPRISVIVPSFNQGQYLEQTMRSVLLQNYPNLELIVIDGGSSDDSVAVLRRYAPWLSYWHSRQDRGQAHAINQGLALASGACRGWLNSDDVYLPGALWRVAQAMRGRSRTLVYGDDWSWDERSGAVRARQSGYAHARYRRYPGVIASHAAFWSADIEQPLWEAQHCALDYELWLRLLPTARTVHLHAPLGAIREHAAAKSHSEAFARQWQEDARRNGQVHAEAYRTGAWHAREFRWMQRAYRAWWRWRARQASRALARAAGWTVSDAR